MTASLLVAWAPSPAAAAGGGKVVLISTGDKYCDKGEQVRIQSAGRGVVINQIRKGPPHLGYGWVAIGKHKSLLVSDFESYTGQRGVHGARTIARSWKGKAPVINDSYATCVSG